MFGICLDRILFDGSLDVFNETQGGIISRPLEHEQHLSLVDSRLAFSVWLSATF